MEKIPQNQLNKIVKDFVRLSTLTKCPNCGNETKMVGETRENGNWICPYCLSYFPYSESSEIKLDIPFIKITNQLDREQDIPKGSILLGDPIPAFPMVLTGTLAGFLVPSYGPYKIKRKRNILLATMDDFSRTGRDKGGAIFQFDLGWIDRPREEYEELISFADNLGYHLPFSYHDMFRNTDHVCYFDSDVSDAEPSSFDNVNFSVRITE